MTGDELQWHLEWRGAVVVVRTAEEALRAIGVIGEEREIQEGRVFKAHDRKAAVVGEKGEA